MNNPSTLELIRIIGNPFAPDIMYTKEEHGSADLYEYARKNKIPLLYLEALNHNQKLNRLKSQYENESAKYMKFIEGVDKASRVLENAGIHHAVFKTIRPYPSCPGDIDILIFGDKITYVKAAKAFLKSGYIPSSNNIMNTSALTNEKEYEVAAELVTTPDYALSGRISPTGTEFRDMEHHVLIDLQTDIALNYLVYVDKKNLCGYTIKSILDGKQSAFILLPALDLVCLIAHSVAEQLYNLSDFYSFLFYIARMDDDNINLFISAVNENEINTAASAFIAVTISVYAAAYGEIPEKLNTIRDKLGFSLAEKQNIESNAYRTPHMYKVLTVANFLMHKMRDLRFRNSIPLQLLHLIDPRAAYIVLTNIINMRLRKHSLRES